MTACLLVPLQHTYNVDTLHDGVKTAGCKVDSNRAASLRTAKRAEETGDAQDQPLRTRYMPWHVQARRAALTQHSNNSVVRRSVLPAETQASDMEGGRADVHVPPA